MSNLPWSIDLTLQFPMQYSYLQHWIYFHYRIHHFHFTSFFLDLLIVVLCSSPVAYCTLAVHLSVSYFFLPFYTVPGVLTASILESFAVPLPSGSRFVRTLHYDLSILGGLSLAWLIASLTYATPSLEQGPDP